MPKLQKSGEALYSYGIREDPIPSALTLSPCAIGCLLIIRNRDWVVKLGDG